MSDDLKARLRAAASGMRSFYKEGAVELIPTGTMDEAADHIEALEREREKRIETGIAMRKAAETYFETAMQQKARAKAAEARLDKAVEALRALHHAVCGETGFAACVRIDRGKAYPWPALDEADEMTRATLAEIGGK